MLDAAFRLVFLYQLTAPSLQDLPVMRRDQKSLIFSLPQPPATHTPPPDSRILEFTKSALRRSAALRHDDSWLQGWRSQLSRVR